MKKEDRTCANCRYSEETEIDPNTMEKLMVCKRLPPQQIALPHPQGIVISTNYPNVTGVEPCHEHSPKLPPKPTIN